MLPDPGRFEPGGSEHPASSHVHRSGGATTGAADPSHVHILTDRVRPVSKHTVVVRRLKLFIHPGLISGRESVFAPTGLENHMCSRASVLFSSLACLSTSFLAVVVFSRGSPEHE